MESSRHRPSMTTRPSADLSSILSRIIMKRLLILGATGSLGRHVLQQAVAAGHQVSVLVRNPARLPQDLRSRITVHQVDLGPWQSAPWQTSSGATRR